MFPEYRFSYADEKRMLGRTVSTGLAEVGDAILTW